MAAFHRGVLAALHRWIVTATWHRRIPNASRKQGSDGGQDHNTQHDYHPFHKASSIRDLFPGCKTGRSQALEHPPVLYIEKKDQSGSEPPPTNLVGGSCKTHKSDGICSDPPEFPGINAKIDALVVSEPAMQSAIPKRQIASGSARSRYFRYGSLDWPGILHRISRLHLHSHADCGRLGGHGCSHRIEREIFRSAHPRRAADDLQAVGHFTFLDTCAEQGRAFRPPFASTRPVSSTTTLMITPLTSPLTFSMPT